MSFFCATAMLFTQNKMSFLTQCKKQAQVLPETHHKSTDSCTKLSKHGPVIVSV